MFSRGERHLLPSGSSASARGGKSRGRGDRGRGRGGRGGGGRGGRTAGFSSSDSISKSDSEGGSHNLPITAAQAESQATVEESKGVAVILSSSASFCDFHTWIYSIELNGDSDSEILPLEPIICFGNELPLAMTFVIVNSTLYMFGGFNPDNDPPIRWESRMYTYPLDSALLSNPSPSPNRNCNPKLIQNGPSMKTPKVAPMSIVVCGKICVYSQSLSDARKPNFEVYDPATNLWSELPEPSEYYYSPYELSSYRSLSLPVEDRPSRSILVEGVFVRNSTLYISISSISSASYAFDFDPSSSCTAWQPVSFAGRRPSSRMRGIVVDDYYLSPYIGFNLTATEGLQHSFYLTPSGDPRNSLAAVCGHTDMLDLGKGADGDSRICIFTAGFKEYPIGKDGDVPHLLVDIFQCLTSESRQLKVIQKKCFTFLLTTKIRCETIDFAGAFFIPSFVSKDY